MPARLISIAALVLSCSFAALGCGGGQESSDQTTLLLTKQFGAEEFKPAAEVAATKGLTAMRQLQTNEKVDTTYGGRFVNAINGTKGGGGSDWLFFVDGVASDVAATEVRLYGGEIVQWDFHPWQRVRTEGAIVGAYPQPLRRRGVKLSCAPSSAPECGEAESAFESDGISVSSASGAVVVQVGRWSDLSDQDRLPTLAESGGENGVFASVTRSGDRLELVDANGDVATTLGGDVGLLAAVRDGDEVTWLVTGLTQKGVGLAIKSLNQGLLRSRFAMAVTPEGPIPLPVAEEIPAPARSTATK